MYKAKIIKNTLKKLKKFDYQFSKTSKVTGIKVNTIRSWYREEVFFE